MERGFWIKNFLEIIQLNKMKLLFKMQGIKYNSIESLMLGDKEFAKNIYYELCQKPFIKSLKYFGIEDKKKAKIIDLNSFIRLLKNIKEEDYIALDDLKSSASNLEISFSKKRISFYFVKELKIEESHKMISEFLDIFLSIYSMFNDKVTFDLIASISYLNINYSQPRPPRVWRKFNPSAIVDIIIYRKEKLASYYEKVVHQLCFGKLPSWVQRNKKKNNIFIIDWRNNKTIEEEISDLISQRILWFQEYSGFNVNSLFNNEGDKQLTIINPVKTKYFTFYSSFNSKGYKGIWISEKLDENIKLLLQMKSWIKAGITPDGNPISEINLIVPTKDEAISFYQLAQKYGINSVLFATDDGKLWNPFPPGNWLN